MPKKKTERDLSPETDSERETRVLLEGVRSELKVVAEGHGSIIGRLDKVEGSLKEVEGSLKEVKGDLQEVKGRLNRVETKIDRVDNQVSQLQDQVSSVLTDHESRLKVLEAK